MIKLFSIDDPEHSHASEVLPWYVNGSLNPVENARVEHHVAQCAACRAELACQQELMAAVQSDPADSPVQGPLARMHARLTEHEGRSPPRGHWLFDQWNLSPVAMRTAFAAQWVLLLALVLFAGFQQTSSPYRTLSAAPAAAAAGARLTVLFDDATTQAELRDALQRVHARVVDGPNSVGALSVQVASKDVEAALRELRASPHVRLAERAPASASAASSGGPGTPSAGPSVAPVRADEAR
jgi:hypothetical protein